MAQGRRNGDAAMYERASARPSAEAVILHTLPPSHFSVSPTTNRSADARPRLTRILAPWQHTLAYISARR